MPTLLENVNQAVSDFADIKTAIETKGVTVPSGTPTSSYAEKIGEIKGEYTAKLKATYDIDGSTLYRGTLSIDGELSLVIPNGVTRISNYAFTGCRIVTSLKIPNSVIIIGDGAFNGCNGLKSLTLSQNLGNIGSYAFNGCIALTSLVIPNRVTTIDHNAFNGCNNITYLVIPVSVTSIGSDAFSGCNSLSDIYYSGTQAQWESIYGISSAGFKGTETIHYNYTPT